MARQTYRMIQDLSGAFSDHLGEQRQIAIGLGDQVDAIGERQGGKIGAGVVHQLVRQRSQRRLVGVQIGLGRRQHYPNRIALRGQPAVQQLQPVAQLALLCVDEALAGQFARGGQVDGDEVDGVAGGQEGVAGAALLQLQNNDEKSCELVRETREGTRILPA